MSKQYAGLQETAIEAMNRDPMLSLLTVAATPRQRKQETPLLQDV